MSYFPTWKIVLILAVAAFGALAAAPNLLSRQAAEALPDWIPHRQISLGLDLQGGSHLLLDVDTGALIRERLERPMKSLDLGPVLEQVGYAVQFAEVPTALQKAAARDEGGVNLRTSLGLSVSKDGTVVTIIPGSPADRAGMRFTSKVLAVNGWVYSPDRLRDAVKDSAKTQQTVLLTSFDDRVETFTLDYAGGPRVPRLIRVQGREDLLEKIAAPLSKP